MEKVIKYYGIIINSKTVLIDLFILCCIYFIPSISHLLSLPLYYLDPMRIALVIALIHTSRRNALFIALTLPLFSYFISAHPQGLKSILLSIELLVNLGLFFYLQGKIKNTFTSLLFSIVVSKIFYYTVKSYLISYNLINDRLFSTPLYFQAAVALLLSVYIYFITRNRNNIGSV